MWYDNLIPRKIVSWHEFDGMRSTITPVNRGWRDAIVDPKDPALYPKKPINHAHRNIELEDKTNIMWAYAQIQMQAYYTHACPKTLLTVDSINKKAVDNYNTEIAIANPMQRSLGVFFESLLTIAMDTHALEPAKYPSMVFKFISDSFRVPPVEMPLPFPIDGDSCCDDLFYALFRCIIAHFMQLRVKLPLNVHKVLEQRLIKEGDLEPGSGLLEQYLLEEERVVTQKSSFARPVGFGRVYGFASSQTKAPQVSHELTWGSGNVLGSDATPVLTPLADGLEQRDLIKQLAKERIEKQKARDAEKLVLQ